MFSSDQCEQNDDCRMTTMLRNMEVAGECDKVLFKVNKLGLLCCREPKKTCCTTLGSSTVEQQQLKETYSRKIKERALAHKRSSGLSCKPDGWVK